MNLLITAISETVENVASALIWLLRQIPIWAKKKKNAVFIAPLTNSSFHWTPDLVWTQESSYSCFSTSRNDSKFGDKRKRLKLSNELCCNCLTPLAYESKQLWQERSKRTEGKGVLLLSWFSMILVKWRFFWTFCWWKLKKP